jgi:hypothetical protein
MEAGQFDISWRLSSISIINLNSFSFIIQSNEDVDGFNHNTHQAQSFKDQCERIVAAHDMMAIYGRPMEITIPFVCEKWLVEWEIQAYPNVKDLLD